MSKLSSSKLIGRETMIGRLQGFHEARIKRVHAGNAELIECKILGFSYSVYSAKSTRLIAREYDETFSTLIERNGKMFWPWEVEG